MEGEGVGMVDWRIKGRGWWIGGGCWEDGKLDKKGERMVDWRVNVGGRWVRG